MPCFSPRAAASPILQARASFYGKGSPCAPRAFANPEFIAQRPAGALMHREGTCHASRPSIVARLCQDRGIDEIEKGADPRRVPQSPDGSIAHKPPRMAFSRWLRPDKYQRLRSAMKQGKGPIRFARAPIASAKADKVIDACRRSASGRHAAMKTRSSTLPTPARLSPSETQRRENRFDKIEPLCGPGTFRRDGRRGAQAMVRDAAYRPKGSRWMSVAPNGHIPGIALSTRFQRAWFGEHQLLRRPSG